MITYKRITDPEQAYELHHAGLLLWKDPFKEGRYHPADAGWNTYTRKTFPTMRAGVAFFVRMEE